MNAKFTLAIIALIGIGVFALPSTMSLFAGQHSFYNIDATGNQVPCQKCHGDVKAELSSNGNTNPALGPITPGPHAAFKCEYCHRIEAGSASGDNAFGLVPYVNSTDKTSRYIIISVADMEAGNIPATIAANDIYINSSKTLAGVTLLHGKGNISANYTGTDAALGLKVGPKNGFKVMATYNTTAGAGQGLPLDINPLTAQGGLDISKATVSSTGTVNLTNAGSKAVNPGSAYHAASLVSCMECHGGEEPMGHYTRVADGTAYGGRPCSDCHYGGGGAFATGNRMTTLQAGGFGLTGMADDTGAQEAHKAWTTNDDGINRFGGPNGEANNGACIGCHTHVAIDVNFQKGYALKFNAIETSGGVYSVSNTAVEGSVNIAIYGNGSGATYAVGDKSYTWNSGQAMYVNGSSTAQVLDLNAESSDSAAALTN